MTSIGIVDYGMGNLRSVWNAITAVGGTPCMIDSPSQIPNVTHLILPGVGAFGEAMKRLENAGWVESMANHTQVLGKPFLGICLGMQLLAEVGYEHGTHRGLGWIKGEAILLDGNEEARIPHIGWNSVEVAKSEGLFQGVESGKDFYFVHSYVILPSDPSVVTGWCQHAGRFAASLQSNNVFATQFHPEKSQKNGLRILKNFCQC
jgi:imidazole glycerol-phosphate synthase subunit HisH